MADAFLGQITLFAFPFAPRGWSTCQGQTISIQQNTALFALLGTFYGGNGTTTYMLPDLRGRVALDMGVGSTGTVYNIGGVGGNEGVALSGAQVAAHNHAFGAQTAPAGANRPQGDILAQTAAVNFYAAPGAPVVLAVDSCGTPGASAAHENRQPFLAMNYCICTSGIFPSRN